MRDAHETVGEPLAFTFMSIIRFQCLFLLELDPAHAEGAAPRVYSETQGAPLTVAVLHTHPDSATFLLDGEYHIRHLDTHRRPAETTVNFVFASLCMFFDGRVVFYSFTQAQFRAFVGEALSRDRESSFATLNRDVTLRCLALEHADCRDFARQCHYTLSNAKSSQTLAGDDGTRVRIVFVAIDARVRDRKHTILYSDVVLFDPDGTSRLHILEPVSCAIVSHFEL